MPSTPRPACACAEVAEINAVGSSLICENPPQLAEGPHMRRLSKSLVLLTMLVCAGCAKPSDASDARRDHVLAGPHGWIDITLHAPVAASAPASASAATLSASCDVGFTVNGERQLRDSVDLAQADVAHNPVGYRFVVPSGTLNTTLSVSTCVKDELAMALSVAMEPEHVARLEFDGQHLALTSTEAWHPVTLEAVRSDVAALQAHGESTDGTLSTLTRLALAGVVLDVVVIAVVIGLAIRRRSR